MKPRRLTVSVVMAAVGLATLPACGTIDDASEAYGQQTQNLQASGTVWVFESDDPETGIWPAEIWAQSVPGTRIPVTRVTLGNYLDPGDTLLLRGAYYNNSPHTGQASFMSLTGTAAAPITIKSYPGETAVFDPGYPEFRSPGAWRRATAFDVASGDVHPDEWVSVDTYGSCLQPVGPAWASVNPDRPTAGCCDAGCTQWRRNAYDDDSAMWGQMLDRKQRLVTYSRVEDMRADNEAWVRVPLEDPRPSGGPLVSDPTKKLPWLYYGPGLWWNQDTGRIHVRLSHTHLNTPGIEDYQGPTDPNELPLSITERLSSAVDIAAVKHAVFEDLVFQNGGNVTLGVGDLESVTFSRVTVYGSRWGIRSSNDLKDVLYVNSVFDGGLAPWTTRLDVKSSYQFYMPDGSVQGSGAVRQTNDTLFVGGGEVEIAYSELRNSHDGMILGSGSLNFHHNLVENINDECFQLHDHPRTTDAIHIHENMFRQVLHPLAPKLPEVNAPVYFYRNVVDQRIPFRGYRFLTPDAPEPVVWRNGDDFKLRKKVGPLYVYQNTFLSGRKSGREQSQFFSVISDPPHDRWFFNNIHVTLDYDVPFISVPPPDFPARSDGNIWYAESYDSQGGSAYIIPGNTAQALGLSRGEYLDDLAALHNHAVFNAYATADPLVTGRLRLVA